MNAQRLVNPDAPLEQRRPHIKNVRHLLWIRTLPCVISGSRENIHAAHVRYGDLSYNKPPTGLGEKPSDCWVLPLRARLHVGGIYSQHANGERQWWEGHGIDPLEIAQELYRVTGKTDAAWEILRRNWK